MATGRLAASRPSSGAFTAIYTVPGGKDAIVNIRVGVTSGSVESSICLAITSTNVNPTVVDYLYCDYVLYSGSEPLNETGIPLTAGNTIWIKPATNTVNCHVYGVETASLG